MRLGVHYPVDFRIIYMQFSNYHSPQYTIKNVVIPRMANRRRRAAPSAYQSWQRADLPASTCPVWWSKMAAVVENVVKL